MGKTLEEIKAGMSKKRQAKIEELAEELIAEEMALRDLRKALNLTQKAVAKKLGMTQDNVSRLESRSDLLLSTLRSYVDKMGGKLHLVAKFPDREPVEITGFESLKKEKDKKPEHV